MLTRIYLLKEQNDHRIRTYINTETLCLCLCVCVFFFFLIFCYYSMSREDIVVAVAALFWIINTGDE